MATAFIGPWFLVALMGRVLGSLLLTWMLRWSRRQDTGQNHRIALRFLRQRGVVVPTSTKRAPYTSFLLSFVAIELRSSRPSPHEPSPAVPGTRARGSARGTAR